MFRPSASVIGMVHLSALPGAPGFDGDRAAVRERAFGDAQALDAGGVDAVLVENFGDAPFYPDRVPAHVVASMTALVGCVARTVDVPVGVNVLRNDARAALAVAAATSASFVRVNVHVGARVTDQGVIEGRAHETVRLREELDADVSVFADVGVKHSAALGREDIVGESREAVERGLADGVVVSGSATGVETDHGELERVAALGDELDVPVLVGSGVTPETVREVLDTADGAIVGTALKEGGETTAPVDPERVASLVEAAHGG
jgi:hypothetical protein